MKRCKAKTLTGERCKNRVEEGAYCHVHCTGVPATSDQLEHVIEETRQAMWLIAHGSVAAGRSALRCVYENREPILKTSLKGIKVLMVILSILTLPSDISTALDTLGKITRD